MKNYNVILLIFVLILCGFPWVLHAQIINYDPYFYYQKSLAIQKLAMIILSSWAGFNFFTGIVGNFKLTNESKYFFQMNAFWNVVNLGIALFGFFGISNSLIDIDSQNMLNELNIFDLILLINAELDILYILTGSFLLNKGVQKTRSRFIGYGRSIILQGGFLFLFDMILYLIHQAYTKSLYQISETLILGFNSL